MEYDANVLIQNIKTLCRMKGISLPTLWNDVFHVQKNLTRIKQSPMKWSEIEQIAQYFDQDPYTLVSQPIDFPQKIQGEVLLSNIHRLCDLNKIPFSTLDNRIWGTRKNLYQWRRNPPSVPVIQEVADFFHVPIESLIDEQPNIEQLIKTAARPKQPDSAQLQTLFRNAANLTPNDLNTVNDMVRFLLSQHKDD